MLQMPAARFLSLCDKWDKGLYGWGREVASDVRTVQALRGLLRMVYQAAGGKGRPPEVPTAGQMYPKLFKEPDAIGDFMTKTIQRHRDGSS